MGPAHLNKVVGPDDGEGEVRVHGLVRLGDGLVRDRELVDLHVVVQQLRHHLLLEVGQFLLIDGVCLGDDGDDVDLAVELLHADQVEALEAVSVRRDEVQARVNPRVVEAVRSRLRMYTGFSLCFLPGEVSLDLQFLLEVRLELVVDVVDNRLETVLLVDLVAVPHSLTQRQLQQKEAQI